MPGKNLAGNSSQKYHKQAIIGLGLLLAPLCIYGVAYE
jgi:hypothetical protein